MDAAGHVAGYWGEVLTVSAQARGIRGLIIDGGVRDAAALKARGFPVWCRGISVRGCDKMAPGTIGAAIDCGGVRVRTGDYVVADDDGVVVVPFERVDVVIQAARVRIEKEAELMVRLAAGEVTLDLMGLREILLHHGIDDA